MTEQEQATMTGGRITELTIENVKKIKAVRIKPDGSLVVISGQNGAGKTSVLDAIEMALAGGRAIPEQPLRAGERKGYVVAKLGGMTVRRTFKANGSSTLQVHDSENRAVSRPQEALDALVGSLTFNPLAFMSMKASDQADELRAMIGLDLSGFDDRRKIAYEDRASKNREFRVLCARLEGMPASDQSSDREPLKVVDLMGKNSALTAARDAANRLRKNIEECRRQLTDDAKKIEDLRKRLDERTESVKIMCKNLESLPDPSQEEIDRAVKAIEQCEETNRRISIARDRRELEEQIGTADAESDILTEDIDVIDEQRRIAIAGADMPIDGLAFDADGAVTYNGILLSQASRSEQIRVSMAIGLAGHKELNIMLIRDGNDLDTQNLALVAGLAEEAGAQVWIERIEGSGPWVIEDGEIADDTRTMRPMTDRELGESAGQPVTDRRGPGTPGQQEPPASHSGAEPE